MSEKRICDTITNEYIELTEPKYGWASFIFKKNKCIEYPMSYVDNVPLMLIDVCIEKLNNPDKPVCIKFDAEGYNWYLILDTNEVVFVDRNKTRKGLYDTFAFIELIIDHLEENDKQWRDFVYDLYDYDEIQARLSELKTLYKNKLSTYLPY